MSERIILHVKMELLSDTIFGSGYSIPGGEDIAVCCDEKGYPYLPGSTFKGLLRESLQNWLVWTDGNPNDLKALLGEANLNTTTGGRQLHLTELRLEEPPKEAESCYANRAFTALKDGVVKQGTLRFASCIRAGMCFGGEIVCSKEDITLVKDALAGIKWVGAMRNRGFGRVHIIAERITIGNPTASISSAHCIRYCLLTQSTVLITDLSHSHGNVIESRNYLPGSAIRGMVASLLAETCPEEFAAVRTALLGGKTYFLDAIPARKGFSALPALMGFYEDKAETMFHNVLISGSVPSHMKHAKLGTFCALDGDVLRCWSSDITSSTRIALSREKEVQASIFQTHCLEAGQLLEGYILLEDPALAKLISKVLNGTVWLGADRYSGFGKCRIVELTCQEQPAWIADYGYHVQEEIGTELYLLAISPFTMLNESGEPCGLDLESLKAFLGLQSLEVSASATSVAEFGGYNRIWESRMPAVQMYERGSLFHLHCDTPPKIEKVRKLERDGLGIRRNEGFGQILFLPPALLVRLRCKAVEGKAVSSSVAQAAEMRRNRLNWVMGNAEKLNKCGLSSSQIGTLQKLAEKAYRSGNEKSEIDIWLNKNLKDRGEQHGRRFIKIKSLLDDMLNQDAPLGELGVLSMMDRLKLFCLLCDYSRKVREEAEET